MRSNKEKIVPVLPEIIKIVSTIFKKLTETNARFLHDFVIILIKNYNEEFKKLEIIDYFIRCIIKNLQEKISEKEFTGIMYLIDIIPSFFKASGYNITNYIEDIILSLYELINLIYIQYENFNLDFDHKYKEEYSNTFINRDVINKCLDVISTIYLKSPQTMLDFKHKNKIVDIIFKMLEINDNYVKHFIIAVIGEIAKIDSHIFRNYLGIFATILIKNLDLKNCYINLDPKEIDNISVCNNSCWTISILIRFYSNYMIEFISDIMEKLIKLLDHSKVIFVKI